MNCPDCGQIMDREDSLELTARRHRNADGSYSHRIPSVDYHCPDCGAEYRWRKGRPLTPLTDAGDSVGLLLPFAGVDLQVPWEAYARL